MHICSGNFEIQTVSMYDALAILCKEKELLFDFTEKRRDSVGVGTGIVSDNISASVRPCMSIYLHGSVLQT